MCLALNSFRCTINLCGLHYIPGDQLQEGRSVRARDDSVRQGLWRSKVAHRDRAHTHQVPARAS
jgi:hypothetical protein